jgi:hypothetical protein
MCRSHGAFNELHEPEPSSVAIRIILRLLPPCLDSCLGKVCAL